MEVGWLHVGMGLFGGLALFLGGLDRLSEGLKQVAGSALRTVLARLTTNRFSGALTGALVTAVLNSSSVTTVLVVGFVTAGVMTLPQSVGVIMGANIGTCATALLATIGKPTAAVRAAVVHLAFNVLGTAIWLPVLSVLAEAAVRISPAAPELEGVARASAEVPRQLANANTLFNVVNTLLFLPFTSWFARLAERLVEEKPAAVGALIEPRFLDDAVLVVPSLALQQVRRETGRLGEFVQRMLEEFSAAVQDRDLEHITAIACRADEVAALQAAILRYLGLLRQSELSQRESREAQELMEAVFHLESLGRLVATNLVDIARQAGHLRPPAEKAEMLRGLYESALTSVVSAVRAVREADVQAAEEVASMRERVDDQVQNLLERQATRLRPEDPEYLVLARLQMSIVDKLGRVYDLAARIARAVLTSRAGTPGGEPPRARRATI